jgi:hypothetical protein
MENIVKGMDRIEEAVRSSADLTAGNPPAYFPFVE